MRSRMTFCLFLFGLLASSSAMAGKIKLVTTTTDLAWAAREIGGDQVDVESLLNGSEDPHFAEAVPKYIRSVANADVVCSVGLGLEVGWLPKVLAKSGNAKVQLGGPGYCELGSKINVLDKVSGTVDRSMGDVHPSGNPHFWLGVSAFLEAGRALSNVLNAQAPDHKANFEKGFQEWKSKYEKTLEANTKRLKAAGAQSFRIMPYHSEFAYFFKDYNLISTDSMEEKPGVAPSAGRLAKMVAYAKAQKVTMLLASETHPQDVLKKFQELSGIPVVIVPVTIKPGTTFADGFALQDALVSKILEHAKL